MRRHGAWMALLLSGSLSSLSLLLKGGVLDGLGDLLDGLGLAIGLLGGGRAGSLTGLLSLEALDLLLGLLDVLQMALLAKGHMSRSQNSSNIPCESARADQPSTGQAWP